MLTVELQKKINELHESIERLPELIVQKAHFEKEYKTLLSKTCLKMRMDGTSISMIPLTVYGVSDVAELRYKRDIAEESLKAQYEKINVLKLELRLLEAEIEREWNDNGTL